MRERIGSDRPAARRAAPRALTAAAHDAESTRAALREIIDLGRAGAHDLASTGDDVDARPPVHEPAPKPVDDAAERAIAALDRNSSGTGAVPLPDALRRDMEGRFGRDFGAVRVHTGAAAAGVVDALAARAVTVGGDMTFASGAFEPDSFDGRARIAHELVHVVQQRQGLDAPAVSHTAPHEQEARELAAAYAAGARTLPVRQRTGIGVARDDGPARMTPAHAGGAMGELDAAFTLGQRGFEIIIGPAGPGGHALTLPGFDIVAYNPKTGELWIVDNKASGGTGTVADASAITRNLEQNLEKAIVQVKAMPDFPSKAPVLTQLEATLDSVRTGKPLPPKVSLKVTSAGGYHSGISGKLKGKGVQFEDFTGPAVRAARETDIAEAKARGTPAGRSSRYPTAPPASGTVPAVAPPSAPSRIPSAPKLPPAADTVDDIAKLMTRLRHGVGRVGRGLKVVFSPKVQLPLGVVMELLNALEAWSMASSGMAGQGFVLREQLDRAKAFASDCADALRQYEAQFHDSLGELTSTGMVVLMGTGSPEVRDELAEMSVVLGDALLENTDAALQLFDVATKAAEKVDRAIKVATELLASPEFAALSGMSGSTLPLAQMMGAREDLYRMRGILRDAVKHAGRLLEMLREDAALVRWFA